MFLKFLRKKRIRKVSFEKLCVIGVMGIGRGVGTTHLCIMIANYLTNGLGKKVALLELNTTRAYTEIFHMKEDEYIKKILKYNNSNNSNNSNSFNNSNSAVLCFKVSGIDLYTNISYNDIPEIMAKEYEYVVLDISGTYMLGRNEFLRSHKKIVVGSLSRWKVCEYLNYFSKAFLEKSIGVCRFLSLAGNQEMVRIIKNKYDANIEQIPFDENPFNMEGKHIEWIAGIIK